MQHILFGTQYIYYATHSNHVKRIFTTEL